MSPRRLLGLVLLLLTAVESRALRIGFFPGLDALIEKADAIVVLRVEEQLDFRPELSDNLYSTYRCYVYQCLKGGIAPQSRLEIRLLDPRTPFVTPFARNSTHLVFLHRNVAAGASVAYSTMTFEGANVRLSPFGNEKMPAGDTTADQVRALLRTAKAYWKEQQAKEDAFIDRVMEGSKADQSVR